MIDDKTYILDPLTCLCKIALLAFLPDKTKIAISHHVLRLQEYNNTQWLLRMQNGDSRVDISYLNMPLMRAAEWYIADQGKLEISETTSAEIKIITEFAIRGLSKLQNSTYRTDLVVRIILQHFINMLRDAYRGNWDNNRCVGTDTNSPLTEKIRSGFDATIVHTIAVTLQDANEPLKSAKDVQALIECGHKILNNRDETFSELMREVTTQI